MNKSKLKSCKYFCNLFWFLCVLNWFLSDSVVKGCSVIWGVRTGNTPMTHLHRSGASYCLSHEFSHLLNNNILKAADLSLCFSSPEAFVVLVNFTSLWILSSSGTKSALLKASQRKRTKVFGVYKFCIKWYFLLFYWVWTSQQSPVRELLVETVFYVSHNVLNVVWSRSKK